MEQKLESKKEVVEKKGKSKKDQILESKMPEEQKRQMLIEIGEIEIAQEIGVEFIVYAKIKQLSSAMTKAMAASAKVKTIRLASIEDWNEILKDF